MVRLYRTFSNYISSGDTRCAGCNMHRFELHPHRDRKVYRLLSHEFGVLRMYRTFSNYISSRDNRCAGQGAICTSSMRFKHIEPHRTFSNYILTEIARCIDFFHTSSGWFDCTEPSPTTSLQGIQGVQGAICTGSGRFELV